MGHDIDTGPVASPDDGGALEEVDPFDVAVIGMAARFPGAPDVATYWENIKAGVESIRRLSPEELRAAGVDPAISSAENYVPYAANLEHVDRFDAAFFGYSPSEAERLDPQQRLFLECAWEALESAGWTGEHDTRQVGVFASSGISGYFLQNLVPRLDLANALMPLEYVLAHTANDKDFVATRVAYKLDLRGPAVTVQTACSSSLVAIHMARQSLLAQECDLALAGGVAIHLPQGVGYVYHEDYPHSLDGHTRTFDADATGTMFGDGAGVVALKRLADAIRDGDPILAVLKGSAINNDGDRKVGYTAPSLSGIVEVVSEALGNAAVEPDTVGYIEAHGTATPQGDPIEVAALSQAFRSHTERVGFCGLGSVKSNMGHLEHAAGVAGFIKAVMMVRDGLLVPSLHFKTPNPSAPLEGSPFYVCTETRPWRSDGPRRAGVSALGVGGTNAHVILEEPPRVPPAREAAPEPRLLCVSGKSEGALRELAGRYATFLSTTREPFEDVCFTSQRRRAHFDHRLAVVASNGEEARARLAEFATSGAIADRQVFARGTTRSTDPRIVWVFSGYGGQWDGLGRDLLRTDPVFREALQAADAAIRRIADFSVLDIVAGRGPEGALGREEVVQPFLFAIQVAMAARFRAWGLEPDAVVGHSMGEIAAAHVAGALTLDEAAAVICHRSRLIAESPPVGAMVLVGLSEAEALQTIEGIDGVSVGSVNGPNTSVLSGARPVMEALFTRIEERGIFCRWLKAANRAGHSAAMDALLPELGERLAWLRPQPTRVPLYSTVEAQPIDGERLDARYWQRNLRQPVRMWAAFGKLVEDGYVNFFEINGHGLLLPPIAALEPEDTFGATLTLVTTLQRDGDGPKGMLRAAGALHAIGHPVDFERVSPGGSRTVPLPTYAFQRDRHWIDAPAFQLVSKGASADNWLHEVLWRPAGPPAAATSAPGRWLVLSDRGGVGARVVAQLEARNARVEVLFASEGDGGIVPFDPDAPEAVAAAIRARAGQGDLQGVVHLWGLDDAASDDPDPAALQRAHALAVGTALGTIRGLDESPRTALWLVTRGAQAVRADEPPVSLSQAPVWGLARAIGIEQPEQRVVVVDLDPAHADPGPLVDDLLGAGSERQLAYRGGDRLLPKLVKLALDAPVAPVAGDGTYLITGGLRGVGLATAQWLVGRGARHLVLVARSAPDGEAKAAIAALEREGVTVRAAACDVSSREAVAALIAEVGATMPPLKGVYHSAVVIADAVLELQDWARFRKVYAAKVGGAWNLHLETRELALDEFVVYSSIAALLPPVGQANYASANAFVDALAEHRRLRGLPATSINWGAWGEVGGAARLGLLDGIGDKGVHPMHPDGAFQAMGQVLAAGRSHVLVAHLDGDRVARDYTFASELAGAGPERASGAGGDREALDRILAAPADERLDLVRSWMREAVIGVLHLPSAPEELPVDQAINSLGMDSLMAMDLRNRAKDELGVVIKLGKLFRGATIDDLCERIVVQLQDAKPRADRPAADPGRPSLQAPAAKAVAAPSPPKPAPPVTPAKEPDADTVITERAAEGWLVVQRPDPGSAMRMICFPYAGGGANVFAGWSRELPPWLEVCAVELPGRGNRLHEKPLERFEDIVDALVPVLAAYLDRPFAFFGHCLGAMVMHAVAQRLEAEHGLRPLHVFVAGAGSPDIYMAVDSSTTAAGDILQLLEEINFASAKVLLEDEEARELLLPGVLADFWLTAKYRYKPGMRYDQPITTFAGFDDVFTPAKQMEGWRDFTTGPFKTFVYPGGHYFIEPERESILRIVSQELHAHHARALPRDPARWFATSPEAPAAPRHRLFCVGYAGGGSRTFAEWQAALPEVEVVSVQLPGRGERANEEPLHRVEDIAGELRAAIEPHLDLPYSLVGHELGALVVWELTQSLIAAGLRPPAQLFVSSEQAPHRRRPYSLQYLPAEMFGQTLIGYKFPHHPDAWRPADLHRYRADFAARSEYERRELAPVDMPIHVFLADRDTMVNPAGAEGWADLGRAGVTFHTVEGSHYHIEDPHPAVLDVVVATLGARTS